MSLSCSCDYDYDDGDAEWYWWPTDDYSTLETSRRKRCCSCNDLIDIGATVAEFDRSRPARTEIEERIYGDGDPESIWLASVYLCERCADLYFSFEDLGFECVSPYENMVELAKQYAETYGKKGANRMNQQDGRG